MTTIVLCFCGNGVENMINFLQVMHWRLAHKAECRQICAAFQISGSSNNKTTLPLMGGL